MVVFRYLCIALANITKVPPTTENTHTLLCVIVARTTDNIILY